MSYFGLAKMYIGMEFFCFLACIMLIQCQIVETIFDKNIRSYIQIIFKFHFETLVLSMGFILN
jgi:hypothetical protein